jgi:hydroxypyruvate isomerase
MDHRSKPTTNRISVSRRGFVASATAAMAAVGAVSQTKTSSAASTPVSANAKEGRLNQSVCRWCFNGMSLDDLCKEAKEMGMVGIDLLSPNEFETVKKYGLVCTMVSSHPLTDGLCDPKYHDSSLKKLNEMIESTAKEGWRNVICFSGNARGIDRKTGLKNCAEALKKIVPVAEKAKVILNMELLNSRVDHADYMCDRSDWGIELVKEVGSNNFKLLYDIYHMQIMEGDIIRSIQKNHQYFGHYHTAGNPGRHEMDDTQELLYPPIAKAIAETGFDGYFAHEFLPVRDPMTSLREAVKQCTV